MVSLGASTFGSQNTEILRLANETRNNWRDGRTIPSMMLTRAAWLLHVMGPVLGDGALTREDGDAFRALFFRHETRLVRIAGAFAHRAADRDDLVQDMALALWSAMRVFRGECSETTFVYRVAQNTALKFALKKRLPLSGAEHDVECTAPNAETVLAESDESERLRRAVSQLPFAEREVVVLALEDLSPREIADITGLRENAVVVRLHRAKARLRTLLGDAT